MEGESSMGSVGPSFTKGRLQSFAGSVRHHIVGVLCEGVRVCVKVRVRVE